MTQLNHTAKRWSIWNRERWRALILSCAVAFGFTIQMGLVQAQTRGVNRPFSPPPGSIAPNFPRGTFVVHDGALLPGDRVGGNQTDTIRIQGSQVWIGSCRTKATFEIKAEVVLVRAYWGSCGATSNVTLIVEVDKVLGSTLQGLLHIGEFIKSVVATKTYGDSLLIGTYNVQHLPSHFSAGSDPANATRVGKRIKASGYDIIALNEVFDEDSREAFVDVLKSAYPYRVEYLSGGTAINEDSGLMLFSRYPFQNLPVDIYNVLTGGPFQTGTGTCQGTHCSKVAYLEFQDCEGDDCFAEKGVGFVRILNPGNNQIYNIAFTHMQASYAPAGYPAQLDDLGDAKDQVIARYFQLRDIRDIIQGTLTPAQLQSENIFLLGDLNVDGDLGDPDLGFDQVNKENLYEYNHRFTSSAPSPFTPFYWDTIRDGWATSNAPKHPSGNYDRGFTNISGWSGQSVHDDSYGARLDYIFLSPGRRLCAQHMTLSHNLRWSPNGGKFIETGLGPKGVGMGGLQDLSDHYGVNMDINREAPLCSPATALVSDPAEGVVLTFGGNIAFPGSIQWYRFDSPGTWSFHLTSNSGADFRVYQGTDLTTPVPQYKNETTEIPLAARGSVTAKQFRIGKAPFYVRVYNPERTATGGYNLIAMRHDCSTKEFACALAPGQLVERNLSPNPPLNGQDEMWFELYTEGIPSGKPQDLRFLVSGIEPSLTNFFELDVRIEDPQNQDPIVGMDLIAEADPESGTGKYRLISEDQQAKKQKYYMVVRRNPTPFYQPPYPGQATHYFVRWETNLTILFGASRGGQSLQLRCLEENDPAIDDGDDEIFIDEILVDGNKVLGTTYVQDFDAGDKASLESIMPSPLYFVDKIVFKGFEDDGFLNGELDPMSGTINTLPPSTTGFQKKTLHLYPDGGHYTFWYNLTHGFDD